LSLIYNVKKEGRAVEYILEGLVVVAFDENYLNLELLQ
jgi:hypothetical protein